ncbi:potassium channel protein [Polyangium sp. y55x31]|uniref:potassium channel family protein n=1 Tax=Polyangium sp. y55x31 TaxID=3042688 RepID=UPI002482971E|nr:potassium channel protein [Polyangium sp. y55x31]MDI1479687.1 NAD-binding protein [Polyangium sp. y55x31]
MGPPLLYASLYLIVATLVLRWDLRRGGEPLPDFTETVWSLWTLLVFEPTEPFPHTPVARAVFWLTPLAGLFLLAQGVFKIGASLFDLATRREVWTSIMTDMMNGHVVVCGVGHVGYRVIEELCTLGEDVVAIEQNDTKGFLEEVREKGVPVHIGDARRDELLEKVGAKRAKAVVCATSDDLANLEIALDAKRMNPSVRVVMRMFDQRLAGKVGGALGLDQSFSTSALSAPLIAIQATYEGVRAAYRIDDVVRVTAEVKVGVSHAEATVMDLEERLPCRVVSRRKKPDESFGPVRPRDVIHGGDTLVVDTAAVDLPAVRFQLG